MSAACFTRTAAPASSFVAGYGVAVGVFLAPKFHFFFLGALYSSLTHLLVVLDLGFREMTVFPEDDVEAEAEYAKCDQGQCSDEDLH